MDKGAMMGQKDGRGGSGAKPSGLSRLEFLRIAGVGAGLAAAPAFLGACEALVGGGSNGGGGGGGGAGGAGGGQLRIATEPTYEGVLKTMFEKYKAQNPDFEPNVSYAPSEQLKNTLRTQVSSGNAPDIVHVWPGTAGNAMAVGEVAPLGVLADLSDQPWSGQVPERARSLLQHDGQTVMFSPGLAVVGALYYKPIFENLGLEIPQTWEELLSACEEIKRSRQVPFSVGNKESVFTQFMSYALVPSTVFAEDPNFDREHLAGRRTFSDSGWREALEKYQELEQRGFFNENSLGTSVQEAQQRFFTGEAAMMVVPAVGLPTQMEQYEAEGKVGVFALPGASEPENVWIAAAPASGWGAYAEGQRVDAAKDLIGFFGSTENVNTFAEATGTLPIIPNEQAKIDPALEGMVSYIEDEKYAAFPDQRWPTPEVQLVHQTAIQQMFAGELSVDGVLQRMDEAFQKGLEESS